MATDRTDSAASTSKKNVTGRHSSPSQEENSGEARATRSQGRHSAANATSGNDSNYARYRAQKAAKASSSAETRAHKVHQAPQNQPIRAIRAVGPNAQADHNVGKVVTTETYKIGVKPNTTAKFDTSSIVLPVAAATAALAVGVGVGSAVGATASQSPLGPVSDSIRYGSAATVTKEGAASARASYNAHNQALAEQEAQRQAELAAQQEEMERQIAELERQQMVEEINSMPEMFLSQQGSDTCTLCANTMMLRRAAYLDGRDDWMYFTESALRPYAWTWAGVPWQFSYSGYTVQHFYFNSAAGESRLDEIVSMLESHPEGVVVYDPYVPHAVLAIGYDYEEGVLYCADPAGFYAGSAIPAASTWNGSMHGGVQAYTVNGFTQGWVITGRY